MGKETPHNMQFNDTSTYDGLVQLYERWTRQPRATVSGDTNLLKEFTASVNSSAFARIMPLLLAYNDQIRWDDLNHSDQPVGYVNLVASQNDYKITTDANSLDILNITHVRVLQSSNATNYVELERVTADSDEVADIISPDSGATGTPSRFLELGNVLYLDTLPSYSATNGIEIFFGRQQSYFVYTDTTKEPGIPLPFHELLGLYPALDWNIINRTDDGNLISLLQQRIMKIEKDLKEFIDLRHPTKARMTPAPISYI